MLLLLFCSCRQRGTVSIRWSREGEAKEEGGGGGGGWRGSEGKE